MHCEQKFILPYILLLWPKILSGVLIVWNFKSCVYNSFYSPYSFTGENFIWLNGLERTIFQFWFFNCNIYMTHYKMFGLYALLHIILCLIPMNFQILRSHCSFNSPPLYTDENLSWLNGLKRISAQQEYVHSALSPVLYM